MGTVLEDVFNTVRVLIGDEPKSSRYSCRRIFDDNLVQHVSERSKVLEERFIACISVQTTNKHFAHSFALSSIFDVSHVLFDYSILIDLVGLVSVSTTSILIPPALLLTLACSI